MEKYTLQGLEFTLKKATLEQQKRVFQYSNKMNKAIMSELKDALLEMEKYKEDKTSVNYLFAENDYNLKLVQVSTEYAYNENNLKELFELMLDGDVDKIDYKNGDADEMVNLSKILIDNFFSKLKLKQPKKIDN